MKRCPTCNRVETDDALAFCRVDGTALVSDSGPVDTKSGTVDLGSGSISSEIETSILPHTSTAPSINRATSPTTGLPAQHIRQNTRGLSKPKRRKASVAMIAIVALALGGGIVALVVAAYLYRSRTATTAITSIAVMPFVNESGNAEKEFRRAIELNPNYPTAPQQFGIELPTAVRRFDEAIAEGRRAEELDPFSPIIGADLGMIFIRARRFDEAIRQLDRTLALDPNFYATRYYLGMAYHAKGLYAEAIAEYRKALALNDDPWVKAQLARSLAKCGQRDEAVELLRELESESARRYVSSASLALAHGALGEKDKAFAWLEKEVAERTPRPPLFSVNPVFDDLRDDPRFQDLVRRVALAKID